MLHAQKLLYDALSFHLEFFIAQLIGAQSDSPTSCFSRRLSDPEKFSALPGPFVYNSFIVIVVVS
jgi:hypothetical protein